MSNKMMTHNKGNKMNAPPPILPSTGQQQQQKTGMIVGAVAYGQPRPSTTTPSTGNAVNNMTQQPAPGRLQSHNGHGVPQTGVNGGGMVAMAMNSGTEKSNITLANIKEKTPMCLINELARYNKIQHQYTLIDEQGPAHDKNFTVTLKLGEEEYQANGRSIKKAQHSAAEVALGQTTFKHPPPKPPKTNYHNLYVSANNITPTVELNALAMKRGEPAVYQLWEPNRPQYYPQPNYDYRGMYNQRYHYPRMQRKFCVKLKVGEHREFIGEGTTRQTARHSAATAALKVLRSLPMPSTAPKPNELGGTSQSSPATAIAQQQVAPPVNDNDDGLTDGGDMNDELKSEISLVHEIAPKHKLNVIFEVTKETGPPHMRKFVTKCIVGDIVTEGEGNRKKSSKKDAAAKMLVELKKLPPVPPSGVPARPKPRNVMPGNKKKNRNLIKMQKADPGYGVSINPISRLIQIQQAKKEREPVYTEVEQRGKPRNREFVLQVAVGNQTAQGVGPNKKLAKRNAAENMLQLLGYSRLAPQPTKPAIKTNNGETGGDKKVTFVENEVGAAGRQIVPGVLLMPDSVRGGQHNVSLMKPGMYQVGESIVSPQTTSIIARELLDQGRSPTSETLRKHLPGGAAQQQQPMRHKNQLMYLGEILGFGVQFTDFPKMNSKNEYLSLVSLSTNPPQVCHGAGASKEESYDAAAETALKALAGIAVNMENKGSGDGPSPIKVLSNKANKK